MLEQLMRRYVSAECELVLAAVEKWVTENYTGTGYNTPPQVDAMVAAVTEQGRFIDRHVLKLACTRLGKERKYRCAMQTASETAGKILMGEKFDKYPNGQAISAAAKAAQAPTPYSPNTLQNAVNMAAYPPLAGLQGVNQHALSNAYMNQVAQQNYTGTNI